MQQPQPYIPGGVPPLARASRALIAAGSQQLRLNNYSGSIQSIDQN
jgi:hypothetical protein